MKKAILLVLLIIAAWPAGAMRAAAADKVPILLDTDIGSDIDDAFALALILESPEFDLLGVTTVSGDAEARARLTAKLLEDAGRQDVPVVAGASSQFIPSFQCRLGDGFRSPSLLPVAAEEFLNSEINKHPGVTLIAIGPLTNVAALLKKHPDAAKKIKQIVLMGGSVDRGYADNSPPEAEYNIRSDPGGAQVVFNSGVPLLVAPLDVTAMLKLDADARHRIFTRLSPVTNDLTLLYHLWNNETPTLFDPMAVALAIDPTLCEVKSLPIAVDNEGFTRRAEGKPANAAVALHTDPAKFFQFYMSRVAPEVGPAR
ncbi:MAG TPA: nucleoside hydrolase [Terriglobia bacterium]|nr:nucleoside hydrolase [Terriglobia bacterium]